MLPAAGYRKGKGNDVVESGFVFDRRGDIVSRRRVLFRIGSDGEMQMIITGEAAIQELLKTWIPRLGLDRWKQIEPDFVWHDEKFDKETGTFFAWNAEHFTNWPQMCSMIKFNMQTCKDMCYNELEYVVVHELCHIMLCECEPKRARMEERVVHNIATSFIKAYKRVMEK